LQQPNLWTDTVQLFRLSRINWSQDAQHSRSHLRAFVFTTAAMVSLAAIGCGDGPLVPGAGTGSLTASGAVSVSGSGIAVFQTVSSGSTSLFQIVIAPVGQSSTSWNLQIANYSGRLATGTYNLLPLSASSTNPTATLSYFTGGTITPTIQTFNSTSGQLVITRSSPSEIAGTFSFTAKETVGTSTVSVNGSFNAPCAPGSVCQ